ncbi:MAG TPA: hypothetical protein VFH51_00305 [Myxococcota bacterium]|nr:hypothetical protein [Myxococcota bacterium]
MDRDFVVRTGYKAPVADAAKAARRDPGAPRRPELRAQPGRRHAGEDAAGRPEQPPALHNPPRAPQQPRPILRSGQRQSDRTLPGAAPRHTVTFDASAVEQPAAAAVPFGMQDLTEMITQAPEPDQVRKLCNIFKKPMRVLPVADEARLGLARKVTHWLRDTRVCDIDDGGRDVVVRKFDKPNSGKLVKLGIKIAFPTLGSKQIRDLTTLLYDRHTKAGRDPWIHGSASLSTDVLGTLYPKVHVPAALTAGIAALQPAPDAAARRAEIPIIRHDPPD